MPKEQIKKRRRSRCSWCGESIEVGAPFRWWPCVDGDGLPNGSHSMHTECDDAYYRFGRYEFDKYWFERGGTNRRIG